MAQPAVTFPLSPKSLSGLRALAVSAYGTLNTDWQTRAMMLNSDCAYMREGNLSDAHFQAKKANRYGDKSKIQDITVPIVMPQVEAGVTYLSNVFLSGNPIFGVVTTKADKDNIAAQYDAIMEENGIRGGWVREFNMFFRDGLKYNRHGLEVNWEEEKIYSVETDLTNNANEGKPTEAVWQGNRIKRLDMYNTFWDTRVPLAEVHKRGEFAGYIELKSRIDMKQHIQDLGTRAIRNNIKEALESGKGGAYANSYYVPQINPDAINKANETGGNSFDWSGWATEDARKRINYSNSYELMVLYVRIIPSDFDMSVPGRNQPQIWKLEVVNQNTVILAERQTNAHGYLNIVLGQPLEDGLGEQTKSYADNATPMQEAASAMLGASLNSKRRMQFDRLLYNPSLVRPEDINSANPIARIPVKAAAYTKNLSEAVYAFPYNDNASQSMLAEMGLIVNFADKAQGTNAAKQGQFTKGNRTLHEYQDISGNGDGRMQTIAMFIEAQTFTPLKHMLKLNIMQYAPAGEIYSRETKEVVKIDPLQLRNAALEFKVSDGFLPSDKLIGAEVMQAVLQVAPTSPQLMQRLDVAGLFIHWLKTQGAKDLDQFLIPQQTGQQTVDTNGGVAVPATPPAGAV